MLSNSLAKMVNELMKSPEELKNFLANSKVLSDLSQNEVNAVQKVFNNRNTVAKSDSIAVSALDYWG